MECRRGSRKGICEFALHFGIIWVPPDRALYAVVIETPACRVTHKSKTRQRNARYLPEHGAVRPERDDVCSAVGLKLLRRRCHWRGARPAERMAAISYACIFSIQVLREALEFPDSKWGGGGGWGLARRPCTR